MTDAPHCSGVSCKEQGLPWLVEAEAELQGVKGLPESLVRTEEMEESLGQASRNYSQSYCRNGPPRCCDSVTLRKPPAFD